MQSPRIIISGGGTGGHIFPAIAIADAIKAAKPDAEFLFVGAKGRMEMERVPKAGYEIRGLWISGIQRKLSLKNLSFPFKLISSLMTARGIVRSFKPDVAVGVGGYASGPLLQVASSKKIPALIQEQNSFPGITNRLLAKKVNRVCVAYEGMNRWFPAEKIIMTGNPVRKNVVDLAGKQGEAAAYFGLDANKPTLLVVGGSLGARTINQAIASNLAFFKSKGYQLVWQTGKAFADEAKAAVAALNYSGVLTFPFLDRMDFAYSIATSVVSRAGAMSVSEICLTKKPSILVPSPNVSEDHQTKNAKALVNVNAAILVTDAEAREVLYASIENLMSSEEKQHELAENVGKLAYKNAAEKIAQEVLSLIKRN